MFDIGCRYIQLTRLVWPSFGVQKLELVVLRRRKGVTRAYNRLILATVFDTV